VFPGASLSDSTSIDGGSHGAEGKGERNKSQMEVRLYTVWECISEIRDLGDLGSATRVGLLSLEFGWLENLLVEDYNMCQGIGNHT